MKNAFKMKSETISSYLKDQEPNLLHFLQRVAISEQLTKDFRKYELTKFAKGVGHNPKKLSFKLWQIINKDTEEKTKRRFNQTIKTFN